MRTFNHRLVLSALCIASCSLTLVHAAPAVPAVSAPKVNATATSAASQSAVTANTKTSAAPKPAPANDSRALIERGITAYMKDGPEAALSAWLQYSALEGNTEASGQANSLKKVGEFYGPVEGFDILHEHAMSPRTRMVVAVIHYEKGPLFLRMQTYQTKAGHWVATEFNFNTNAIDVMPDSLTFGREPRAK
jgi:hypothetical protein